MTEDTSITPLCHPGTILDPLTEIAREGARQMLAAALKAEAASFVAQFVEERLPDGRQRVVRHGTGPERDIQTGIGAIPVQRQKVRDRAAGVEARTHRNKAVVALANKLTRIVWAILTRPGTVYLQSKGAAAR